ncbi:hypothetical protein GCM10010124_24520 [Pilimelia terevasa]|uniref:DUF4272 domain-containing protein n=1 Tax=Pilimelia terevasa TaxID=53372 RepID=A0A8J3BLT5_9ACTN|nr:DUF4272 domain-containing protein [Pilimelia terevasa]GGK30807.1 hypothetical protein GCM10010124_24520 [Pilimelia terevasa]
MPVPVHHPRAVRAASQSELRRLCLPAPPAHFPLVWEPGDTVELRPAAEMEARLAVLNVVLARCFGLPQEAAMGWLLASHLMDAVTEPEWHFLAAGIGDHRAFVLHLEAVYGLAWLLGICQHLDPARPSDNQLVTLLPDLRQGESYNQWRSRTLLAPRHPAEVAAVLDLYYCLDWGYLEAERIGARLPGMIDANTIGQRRWALEWAVIFHGPYHDGPAGWEEVDLST